MHQVQTNNRQSVVERTQNYRNNIELTNIADEFLQPLQCVGENNIREVIIAPNVIVHSNEQLEELKTNCIVP